MNNTLSRQPRSGFTLVELAVVVLLFSILAGITIAAIPLLGDRQKVNLGATQLQGWLSISKQEAYKDRVLYGIRLKRDATDGMVRKLQFIKQAVDYKVPGTYVDALAYNPGATAPYQQQVYFQFSTSGLTYADFQAAFPATTDASDATSRRKLLNSVAFLEVASLGEQRFHRIYSYEQLSPTDTFVVLTLGAIVPKVNLTVVPATTTNTFVPSPVSSSIQTPNYRIIRSPQLLEGEPELELPQGVAIDIRATRSKGVNTGGDTDLLFTPYGTLQNSVGTNSQVILWVRDEREDLPQGQPLLVAIYGRTGQVEVHPAALTGNAYQFVTDGRSSGY